VLEPSTMAQGEFTFQGTSTSAAATDEDSEEPPSMSFCEHCILMLTRPHPQVYH